MYMWSHLRIGRGSLQPRLYFHDATGRDGGQIHIGFIGPHSKVPTARDRT